ncbi:MAG TPA: hypothetical protein VJ777_10105, partial [Mycobacterium sp.]|nr:hypothetical protein [Mycobacterium sp.]
MAALSAMVFALSWWLGLYLLARDPRKPVLVLASIGLTSFALVVALDAVRIESGFDLLGRIEIYLVAMPGIAWFAVLVELSRSYETWRSRAGEIALVAGVATLAFVGAAMAGSVEGPLRLGHWVMIAAISLSTLGALVKAVLVKPPQPVVTFVVIATLFFALGNAILIIPLGLVPSWLALASTGCDVALLGLAVAIGDAFDEGQALRADMLRSFAATAVVALLFGGQALIGLAVTGGQTALTVLLFTSLAIAIAINVLADPLAGVLDRVAFSRSPALRADRAALRRTEAALPLRSSSPLDGVDEDTFARLTRRALGHYGDLSKLVASPLTALPIIDERLAARGAPDQPLERANELKALLADRIARLKPRDGGDFGTTEQWRYYNSLYFPYVVGVRAYAQNATAAGLDPVARQAWQWLVTEVPQRSLHNWQNAAAR